MKYTLPSGNASIEKGTGILSEVEYHYPQSKKDITNALKESLLLLHSYESSSQQRELDHKRSVLNSIISDLDKTTKEGVREALIALGWTPPQIEWKYDGFIVPEGATHYTKGTEDEYACFYRNRGSQRDDWECNVMRDDSPSDMWIDEPMLPYGAIELPEKKPL